MYPGLEERIGQKGLKQYYLAEKMGITRQTFSKKMHGKLSWQSDQIAVLKDELNLTPDDVWTIFFANVVN